MKECGQAIPLQSRWCCYYDFTPTSQQGFPFIASHPSRTIKGKRASAANGSAHLIPQIALTTRPAKAIKAIYPQTADSAASPLNAALAVAAESCRFCFASQGMTAAASMSTTIPMGLERGSTCPSRAKTEVRATNAPRTKSKPPAIVAARCSSWSPRDGERNRQSTTAAESSSTALSPPKPRRAGLRAIHAAPNDAAASTVIQTSVSA
jgi:hypothetical protein